MKKIYLLLLVVFGITFRAFSQCTETPTPKVLLVGDSWAWFMNTESTINNVFKTWGFSNYKFISNATLAVNGAETQDVMKATTEAEILHQLTINPSIEVVHLSIGGNDFLGDWKVSMTQGATDTLQNEVFERLDSIVRFIKSCKPGIRILWSGYVYTNFQEVISGSSGIGSANQFYGTWQNMEFPTALQFNTVQNAQSDQMNTYAANDPQVEYVEANGLMQYLYGQLTPLEVAPGGTYPAHSVPMPLGDPSYPSPQTAMRDYFVFKDCFHLSTQGYKDLVSYQTQKFYHKFLMDDLYLLSANNSETGTVSSQGNVATTLALGNASGEDFSTVLSFNTTSMADTTLEKASLFLRRESLTGANPLSGSVQVTVKNGNLGSTANVEAADFSAVGDASGTPCQFGSIGANGDWVRLDLPAQLYQYIKNAATTQFVISATGATGKVNFYNSTDPDFAPVLNLKYGQTPSGINNVSAEKYFTVFPNPTTGKLTIDADGESILSVEVLNTLGQVVLRPTLQNNSIDISILSTGMYTLSVTTANGISSQRIMKN